jgi:hypothetical protein
VGELKGPGEVVEGDEYSVGSVWDDADAGADVKRGLFGVRMEGYLRCIMYLFFFPIDRSC